MVLEDRKEDGSSLPQPSGSFSKSSPLELDVVDPSNQKTSPGTVLDGEKVEKKPGGWRAISFILGNETLERLGTIGLLANFMVYLTKVFHLEQVDASNVINIWSGFTNLTPLVGAFISDTYVGRFKTIAFASFATLLMHTYVRAHKYIKSATICGLVVPAWVSALAYTVRIVAANQKKT